MVDRHYDQRFRSLLASLEILAAAAVSNALVLGSFVRDRGTKKQRFRYGSTGGHSSLGRSTTIPRRAITQKTWGSDADLVGDLGMRLDPELTDKSSSVPRPAPVAMSSHSTSNVHPSNFVERSWTFPNRPSGKTHGTDPKSPAPARDVQPGTSFFSDVGGLLGESDPPPVRPQKSTAVHQHQSSTSLSPSLQAHTAGSRRGSHALLQDLGGLMEDSPPSPRTTTFHPVQRSQNSELIEALQSTPPSSPTEILTSPQKQRGSQGLQDVGGLLS